MPIIVPIFLHGILFFIVLSFHVRKKKDIVSVLELQTKSL